MGLPLCIYDNVAFAPRCAGMTRKSELDGIVEQCLRQAALWDEVKDRLDSLGTKLSGGQQQRLTIARALSHQPEILCLDEFSIAIDPVTTMRIEDVLKELRRSMTIILVTNLTQQARRLADRTMFLWNGEIVELDRSEVIFSEHPGQPADLRIRQRDLRMSDSAPAHQHHDPRPEPLVRQVPGADQRQRRHQGGPHHLAHRPVRLRQDHAAALLQPHQRALRLCHDHGRDQDPGQEHLRPGRLADRAAQVGGHGLPAAQSAAHLGL